MLPGFNNNVKHNNVVFHIQTEDGGINNPVIVTHVFVSGNIVDTKRTSYKDILSFEKLEEVVKDLMKEQHREMIKNVMEGKYDEHPLVKDALAKIQKPEREPKKEVGEEIAMDTNKSLDEVILDFLLEEAEKEKK